MTQQRMHPHPHGSPPQSRTVVLGVAASDAHAVANHLIAHALREAGFHVVNLGTCTPVSEFAEACVAHPQAEAVIIGSINGHALEDLRQLPSVKHADGIHCPVVLGGNLSVGSHKESSVLDRLRELGVDHILHDPADLPAVLDRLRDERSAVARSRAAS
ncbi:cobalamin-dependent protein [Streptomyces sp. NPDC087440]|uniref:cobalamin-dependent protein n=1 Tax=Streptomyces sp. NPDC087440 TaxID=3365790 RepID=UPI00380A3909